LGLRAPRVRKHHSKWNPLFWPSHLSLVLQNKEIDANKLERYQDYDDVAAAVERGELVPIPVSNALAVDKRLDVRRRYVRPWTAKFLTDLSRGFYAEFHQPLMVDSAVRPLEVQKKLRRRNRNAAPTEGEAASSHMAGLTVDLARSYMTPRMVRWMELQLLVLHADGLVEVEEEHHQLCFHIMVAKRYDGERIAVETSTIGETILEERTDGSDSGPTATTDNNQSIPAGPDRAPDRSPDPSPKRSDAGDNPLAGPGLPVPE
jgi:hypothetical protein